MNPGRTRTALARAALPLLLLALPPGGEAQVREGPGMLTSLEPGVEPIDLSRRSAFDLRAHGDEGMTGLRGTGLVAWCFTNVTGLSAYFTFGCPSPRYVRDANGTFRGTFFGLGLAFLAPPSDLPDPIDPEASGLIGGGWTVNKTNTLVAGQVSGGADKLWASDRSGSELLALGVVGTEGRCTDFSAQKDGWTFRGFQVMRSETRSGRVVP
jgi:hypothetical protein